MGMGRMETLILYSSERVGDTLAEELLACFPATQVDQTTATLVDSDSQKQLDELDPEKYQPDIVVVLESLDAYISHRLRIGGRPWVLVASFTFDDVYSLYSNTLSLPELGIDAFVSNCQTFLKNMTSMIPSRFCWRPVPTLPLAEERGRDIGLVLNNLLDRDFALVDHAAKVLKGAGLDDKLAVYYHDRVDKDRLPGRVRDYAISYSGDGAQQWSMLKYFLPAPRITDLRGGVVPTEILKALAYGCHPITMVHNALPSLPNIYVPHLVRLNELEEAVLEAARGEFTVLPQIDTSWKPTVQDFHDRIIQMHRRSKANAAT